MEFGSVVSEPKLRPELRPIPLAASPDAAAQLVVARYVGSRLELEATRDVKLLVFLLEVDSGRLSGSLRAGEPGLAYNDRTSAHLGSLGGISRDRVSAAITRLVEAGALLVQEGPDPRLVFSDRVLTPLGASEHIDWQSVLPRLRGRTPALLLLNAVLEGMRLPWEWLSLSYEMLGERSCYSLGMVRHGLNQLLQAGVLERSAHAGRSHEYRCASVVLHGGPRYVIGTSAPDAPVVATPRFDSAPPPARPAPSLESGPIRAGSPPDTAPKSSTVVEIAGLVLRLPEGTVISMGVEADGASVYAIGPHLKIRQELS